jgi:hypothetical protein
MTDDNLELLSNNDGRHNKIQKTTNKLDLQSPPKIWREEATIPAILNSLPVIAHLFGCCASECKRPQVFDVKLLRSEVE